jgi:hypothetical protein
LPASGYSASALYNKANALARTGNVGPAILSYERARLLAPSDPDIADNLKALGVTSTLGGDDGTQRFGMRARIGRDTTIG